MNKKEVYLKWLALVDGIPKSNISPERIQKAITNVSKTADYLTVGWDLTCVTKETQFTPIHCARCGIVKLHTFKALLGMTYACEGCAGQNYKKLLSDFGYDYISHSRHGVESKCRMCSTTLITEGSTIKAGNRPHCEVCHVNNYKRLASAIDFTYLSKTSIRARGTMVHLKCNKDNAVMQVSCGDLRNGQVRCRTCLETKYKAHLALKDCTFISVESKPVNGKQKTRITYANKDGDVFEATSGNVINGKFTVSLKSCWYQKHETYLIVNEYQGKTYCKIGTANNSEVRAKDLKLSGKTAVFVLQKFDDRFKADVLESDLHLEFKEFKLPEEVASLFSNALKSARNVEGIRYTRKDGTSEWFTSDVIPVLFERYGLKYKG